MESRTLVGRWSGKYTYDPMSDILKLPTIEFALEINSEVTGRFRGTVQDDLATGGSEAGTVEGHLSGDRVLFVKRMPALYFLESNRVRHVAECVREWWGLELDGPVPAPPIFYEGAFVADGSLTGRWHVGATTIPIPSGGKQYALDLGTISGKWTATRQD